MKLSNLLLATSAMACPSSSTPKPAYDLENFVTSEDVQFELLMDNVMGGISQATITKDEDEKILKFDGQLSLENNGGFAIFQGFIGRKLTGYRGVRVSAKITDPERIFYVVLSRGMGGGMMWQEEIPLTDQFRSYEIGFNDFDFQFMGWSAGWMPKLSGATTRTVGMLVMDKNTDPFHVEVELIEGLE